MTQQHQQQQHQQQQVMTEGWTLSPQRTCWRRKRSSVFLSKDDNSSSSSPASFRDDVTSSISSCDSMRSSSSSAPSPPRRYCQRSKRRNNQRFMHHLIHLSIATMLLILSNHPLAQASTVAETVTSTHTDPDTGRRLRSKNHFQVRSLYHQQHKEDQDEDQQQGHREDFILITFSDEGVPFEIPSVRMQLYETSGALTAQSRRAIEEAMNAYLNDTMGEYFGDSAITEVTSVNVDVVDERQVTTTRRDERGRVLQQQTGSEVDMAVTLNFAKQPLPSENVINRAMDTSLADTDKFINDYLLADNDIDELNQISSGVYTPVTLYDTRGPTPRPTSAPTKSSAPVTNNNDNNDKTFAEINEGIPVAPRNRRSLVTLFPAMIVGVIVFLLTAICIAQRRKRASELEKSFESHYTGGATSSNESGSGVGLIGASPRSHEQQGRRVGHGSNNNTPQQMTVQRHIVTAGSDSSLELVGDATKPVRPQTPPLDDQHPPLIGIRPNVLAPMLHSIHMHDGETTIHIPQFGQSGGRVYDPTPLVLSEASSVGSSYDEYDHAIAAENILGELKNNYNNNDDDDDKNKNNTSYNSNNNTTINTSTYSADNYSDDDATMKRRIVDYEDYDGYYDDEDDYEDDDVDNNHLDSSIGTSQSHPRRRLRKKNNKNHHHHQQQQQQFHKLYDDDELGYSDDDDDDELDQVFTAGTSTNDTTTRRGSYSTNNNNHSAKKYMPEEGCGLDFLAKQ